MDRETLHILAKTIEYGCWARYASFSDSPGNYELHDEMREHLKTVAKLDPKLQVYLAPHISQMIETLKMSVRDFEGALREIMQNDPEGRGLIMGALENMAGGFRDMGFGVLSKDFLPKDMNI
ncbi:MAG: hypothetical protein WCP89_00570 [archaeon]